MFVRVSTLVKMCLIAGKWKRFASGLCFLFCRNPFNEMSAFEMIHRFPSVVLIEFCRCEREGLLTKFTIMLFPELLWTSTSSFFRAHFNSIFIKCNDLFKPTRKIRPKGYNGKPVFFSKFLISLRTIDSLNAPFRPRIPRSFRAV